ncbi:MAG: DoxX family protein [bacterium]|nr:DoxX family protein [bacterium]
MFNQKRDVLLLLARLLVGGLFVAQGWAKVSNMEMTAGFFGQMGLPAILAYIVSYAELFGGLALILGLWLELAAIGLAIIMLGAIYFSRSAGIEMMFLPAVILGALFALLASGSGRYALLRKKEPATQS